MLQMSGICIIIGTRPEIIKMAPLIRACQEKNLDYFILHTGQHYSHEMDRQMFIDLELPEPKYNLKVGGREYSKQMGMMIREIMAVLSAEKPDIVFVQGDTNTVLAAALAANKLGIKLGHHEAGLRSHDLSMLEETNRIITDHISDFRFAPTQDALKNLEDEGLTENNFLTGNTVVDAVVQNLSIAKKSTKMKELGLKRKGYILATAHRAENVDNKERLKGIIEGLIMTAEKLRLPVVYPIHPRTRKNLNIFGITPGNLMLLEPLGYLDFLQLEANACLIMTDSGGLQEEACILKVPCVTMRDSTERPETVAAGINVLAGTEPAKILKSAEKMISYKGPWVNPFGDGRAGMRIIEAWLQR